MAQELKGTDELAPGFEWKRSPGHMANYLAPERWQWARHLEYLNEKIVQTIRDGGRLLVEVPVRHGKSEICNIWTTMWFLERFQQKRVIIASYEQTWARDQFGRVVRNNLEHYKKQLGVRLSKDLTGAGRWATTREGGMMVTGIGGPITGTGADLLIIDDPFKNIEEAQSDLIRGKVWEWWETTAETRIMPGGAAFILMARWHQDDIAGRIKGGEYTDPALWTVVNLPALAKEDETDPLGRKPGEALWPEMWSRESLERMRRGSPQRWASLYQQDPRPAEGNAFERDWFEIVEDFPADAKMGRSWDLAGTEKSQGDNPDFTVGIKMAEKDGTFYVLDMIRKRLTPGRVQSLVKQTAMVDGRRVKIYMQEDPGQAGKDQMEHYHKRVLKGFAMYSRRPTGSKETRADPWSAAAQAGNVKLLRGPWNKTFLDEHEMFPNGVHDDVVDAASEAHANMSPMSIVAARNMPKTVGRKQNVYRMRTVEAKLG